MKKKYLIPLIFFVVLAVLYAVGPEPATPDYSVKMPEVPSSPEALMDFVASAEARHLLKPGNEAKIIWANDTLKERTPFAFVYLHGFSASHHEGYPLHVNLAQRYGSNLYLARLHDHGIDTAEALLRFSAEGYYRSALRALAIGKQLGEKVILVSTSTGCTAALKLASEFEDVHALVNLSPNVRINDPFAFMLNDPWGLQIANVVLGDKYRYVDGGPEYAKYWNTKYRNEAIVALQELVETTMTEEVFGKITCPVFNGYYYASDTAQDKVVRVDAIEWMHEKLATPDAQKVLHPFATPGNHVLASPIKSKDVQVVEDTVIGFLEQTLGLEPR